MLISEMTYDELVRALAHNPTQAQEAEIRTRMDALDWDGCEPDARSLHERVLGGRFSFAEMRVVLGAFQKRAESVWRDMRETISRLDAEDIEGFFYVTRGDDVRVSLEGLRFDWTFGGETSHGHMGLDWLIEPDIPGRLSDMVLELRARESEEKRKKERRERELELNQLRWLKAKYEEGEQ